MTDYDQIRKSLRDAQENLNQNSGRSPDTGSSEKKGKSRWQMVWGDKRGYFARFGLALLPCLLISFMIFVSQPVNLVGTNSNYFTFSIGQILVPLLLACVAGTLLGTAVVAVLRGRIFNWMLGLLVGIGLAACLQTMYLNINIGALDGTVIPWHRYQGPMLLSLLIWFLILKIPLLIRYFARSNWQNVFSILTVTLLLSQAVAPITMALAQQKPAGTEGEQYPYTELSGDEQFVVSENENVIVMILDFFSTAYFDDMMEVYPDALDAFHDFTYYNNADSTYMSTFPSTNFMLTGMDLDPTKPVAEYFTESWASDKAKRFYEILRENNYKANLFHDGVFYDGAEHLLGSFDNVYIPETGEETFTVDYPSLLKEMAQLSLYNYAPMALKPSFWPQFIELSAVKTSADYAPVVDQPDYMTQLKESGLTTNADSNYFIVQMLHGVHLPYNIDEYGNAADDPSYTQAARGSLAIMEEYIRQLQELGVYDNSTIIITSDHGFAANGDFQMIYFVKRAGETGDEVQINTAPVTHREFMATILDCIGANESLYGRSIFDIPQNEVRERSYYVEAYDDAYPDVLKSNSNATGMNNVLYVYQYTGDGTDSRKAFEDGPAEIIPLYDSYF